MKTVLVVAYHFPPGGGPGVQRVLKHVTYLKAAGWRPIVLTVLDGDFPARDESLVARIPVDVPVIRVPILEPYNLYRMVLGRKGAAIDVNVNKTGSQRRGWKESLAEFIRATFFIPDARIGWLLTAIAAGMKAIKDYNVDAIYSSSPPYTCALIARALKRRSGLPWVAGFRDPWTGFLTTPDRWWLPAAVDRALERSVFKTADAVECAWQGIIDDALAKVPSLDRSKFHHVPNGYDSSDFPTVEAEEHDHLVITYTGSMYGRRNPRTFLAALESLLAAGRLGVEDVEIRLVGRFGDDVLEIVKASAFAPSVRLIGYVPHRESIGWLLRSDVLLLIVDEAPESAEIVPGKVYEYLGTKRAVLALAPTGSAIERLIQETQGGISVPQDDVEGIAQAIGLFADRKKAAEPLARPLSGSIEKYERKHAAEQLALILTGVTS
ncbi:MAG: glycosyltransferase [Candidatus Kapabacteria bacterium]|jgi:glycosyltransferase involved in cell wall biosynthesis|nr:glycosyltransferase [Candidatus Kapabacteria bacterium]